MTYCPSQQRRNLVDGALCACRRFFQRLARPGMTGTCSPEGLDPVAFQRGRQRARPVTPHIPFKTAGLHSPAGAYALGSGRNPIQRCRPTHRGPQNQPIQRFYRPLQRTGKHTALAESFGEGLAQAPSGIRCLLLADRGQRDVRAPGMLPGFAPHGLAVAQQHQKSIAATSFDGNGAVHVPRLLMPPLSLRSFMTRPLTPIFCAEMIEMLLD